MIISLLNLGLLLLATPGSTQAESSDAWGGGRLFIAGEEIVPPVEFSGFGGERLFANGICIDPLPCEKDADVVHGRPWFEGPLGWCGTGPSPDPWRMQLARQDRVAEDFVVLSSLPLVMIGCDYFYRPTGAEAERVLQAIDSSSIRAVIETDVPQGVVRDLRQARAQ